MTGPEHYAEAEWLMRVAQDPSDPRAPLHDRDALLVLAQVHATLALTAATAVVEDDESQWLSVLHGVDVPVGSGGENPNG